MSGFAAGDAVVALEEATELERRGAWEQAETAYAEAFDRAVAGRAVLPLVDSIRGLARVQQHRGAYEVADELAILCMEIAERLDLPAVAARALNMVAANRFFMNSTREARALWEECFERALDAGDGFLAGSVAQNLGITASLCGELEEARRRYLECIAAAVSSGMTAGLAAVFNNLAILCSDQGDQNEALLYVDRGVEHAERNRDRAVLARLYMTRAEALLRLGQPSECRLAAHEASILAKEIQDHGVRSLVERCYAELCRRQGSLGIAAAHAADAIDIAARAGRKLELAKAQEEMGCIRRTEGDGIEAAARWTEARAIFSELGASRDVARVGALLEGAAETSEDSSAFRTRS